MPDGPAVLRGFDTAVVDIGDRLRLCHPLLSFEGEGKGGSVLYFARRLNWRNAPGNLTVADPSEASDLATLLPKTCTRSITSGEAVVAVGAEFAHAATTAGIQLSGSEMDFTRIRGAGCWISVATPASFAELKTRLTDEAQTAFDDELQDAARRGGPLSERGNAALLLLRRCGPRRRVDLAIRQLAGARQNGEHRLYRRLLMRFSLELGMTPSLLKLLQRLWSTFRTLGSPRWNVALHRLAGTAVVAVAVAVAAVAVQWLAETVAVAAAERQRLAAAEAEKEAKKEAEQQRLAEAARRRAASWRPGQVVSDGCDGCPKLVVIPAGTFMMGSPTSEEGRHDDEGPRHEVTLESFALGVTEVTFDEWEACVCSDECNEYLPDDRGWGRGARPVINVSWVDAQAYVRWLSKSTGAAYRLPSESEWEYAARAGTATSFHTGATISTDQANYDGSFPYGSDRRGTYRERTTPVGKFAPNAFGLYDVHGNVWEWVEDCWHDDYRGAPSDGTAWTAGEDCGRRVLRGGSWYNFLRVVRSANRYRYTTWTRVFIAGFRVSRTIE